MSKHLAIRALVMLSLLTTSALLAQADSGNVNPAVLPPHARAFGATYAQWAARWWTWAYSIPADQSPIVADEADCTLNQGGHVWFLSGRPGGITRDCTIPAGMPIFFPLVNILNDYPCPDPNFQPAPGQTLEAFLTEGARALIDLTTELEARLDGIPLQNLFDYRATSRLFTFTGDPSLTSVFDPCVTGPPQVGVADGYWVMLAPLSRGEHTLHFRAKLDFGGGATFEIETTYHLTIGE